MKDDIQQAWSDSAKQLQQGMEENWARAMQSLQQMAQAAKPDPVGAGLPKIEFSPAKLQELQQQLHQQRLGWSSVQMYRPMMLT